MFDQNEIRYVTLDIPLVDLCLIFIKTSPASHFVPLQASPAGLLGRFAHSHFALRAHENFQKKKCVSIDTKKIFFTSLTFYALRAASGEPQFYLPLRSLRSLGFCASRTHSQLLRSLGLCASRSFPTP